MIQKYTTIEGELRVMSFLSKLHRECKIATPHLHGKLIQCMLSPWGHLLKRGEMHYEIKLSSKALHKKRDTENEVEHKETLL